MVVSSFCPTAPATDDDTNRVKLASAVTADAKDISDRLNRSLDAFVAGNRRGAEFELLKLSSIVHDAAQHQTEGSRMRLNASVASMRQLAGKIQDRSVKSESELRHALAAIHLDMAVHHTNECQNCLKHSETESGQSRQHLGRGLSEGLIHYEEAGRFAGQKLESATRQGLTRVRETAQKFRDGATNSVADAGHAVHWLGIEIRELAKSGRIGIAPPPEESLLLPSLLR